MVADPIFAEWCSEFEAIDIDADEPDLGPSPTDLYPRLVNGATFVLDDEDGDVAVVWGDDAQVAWAAGESLHIVGPQGVGKSTLAEQLALARCGLRDELLGLPVAPGAGRTLYLAADRPKQVLRSMRRMVTESDRTTLASRLYVHKGPLPFPVATRNPKEGEHTNLAMFAEHVGADTVIVDSLKDIAVGLADDEIGARVNLALQEVVARGIELVVIHHQRKEQHGGGKPKRLADVYGSTWITGGAGSVLLLWGDAGDPIVELVHLKQPLDEIGPHNLVHDHAAGHTTLHEPVDLETLLWERGTDGLTAAAAAAAMYGNDTKAVIEKARRRLQKLEADGRAQEFPGNKTTPATWVSTRGGADAP